MNAQVLVCDSCARIVRDPCEAERVSGLCLTCLSGVPPAPDDTTTPAARPRRRPEHPRSTAVRVGR
jgi:hypothetical protein